MVECLTHGLSTTQFDLSVEVKKVYLNSGEGITIDSNVVIEGILIFNVKLESYFSDLLVDCCVDWGGKYAIVHLENEYDFSLV